MASSQYEKFICKLLNDNNILYKREQIFLGLKGNKDYLRFDFVIYNRKNYEVEFLLEVNGEQHYKPIPHWGGLKGLQKRKEYDRKKMSYALAHNIPLICLPYWDINEELTYLKVINEPKYKVATIWHNDNL